MLLSSEKKIKNISLCLGDCKMNLIWIIFNSATNKSVSIRFNIFVKKNIKTYLNKIMFQLHVSTTIK